MNFQENNFKQERSKQRQKQEIEQILNLRLGLKKLSELMIRCDIESNSESDSDSIDSLKFPT